MCLSDCVCEWVTKTKLFPSSIILPLSFLFPQKLQFLGELTTCLAGCFFLREKWDGERKIYYMPMNTHVVPLARWEKTTLQGFSLLIPLPFVHYYSSWLPPYLSRVLSLSLSLDILYRVAFYFLSPDIIIRISVLYVSIFHNGNCNHCLCSE